MNIVDIKIFVKNEKELNTYTKDKNMQPGYRNGIWDSKNVPSQKGKEK